MWDFLADVLSIKELKEKARLYQKCLEELKKEGKDFCYTVPPGDYVIGRIITGGSCVWFGEPKKYVPPTSKEIVLSKVKLIIRKKIQPIKNLWDKFISNLMFNKHYYDED
jgi:hypothetical protein